MHRIILCISIHFALGPMISCAAQVDMKSLDFLIGTWKVEGKESFEVWEKKSSSDFVGESYKIKEGQKRVTETLRLFIEDGQIIYSATVPDQNSGETILFTLSNAGDEIFSFENTFHDFPKKIQYKLLRDGKIFVQVLGENDEGFSFYMERQ